MTRDYFETLGLERRLQLDAQELEQRRISLSRQWHPDRFAGRPAEVSRATEWMSLIQDAYRTLRDPVRRAEYVLSQSSENEADGRGSERGSADVPPDLLEEVFAFNELIEDLQGGDEAARARLEQAAQQFRTLVEESDRELAVAFAAHDEGGDALAQIRKILNRRRYLNNLVIQAEAAGSTWRAAEGP